MLILKESDFNIFSYCWIQEGQEHNLSYFADYILLLIMLWVTNLEFISWTMNNCIYFII